MDQTHHAPITLQPTSQEEEDAQLRAAILQSLGEDIPDDIVDLIDTEIASMGLQTGVGAAPSAENASGSTSVTESASSSTPSHESSQPIPMSSASYNRNMIGTDSTPGSSFGYGNSSPDQRLRYDGSTIPATEQSSYEDTEDYLSPNARLMQELQESRKKHYIDKTECCKFKSQMEEYAGSDYLKTLVSSWKNTSPMHAAVINCHHDCLSAVLKQFPDQVNIQNSARENPLYIAAARNNHKAVMILLRYQADVHTMNNKIETPLMASISNGNVELCKALIVAGAVVNKKGRRGWTAVHEAVHSDKPDILRLLLAHRGNPNIRDSFGVTPVFIAGANGRNQCLEILLRSGGDPNIASTSKAAPPLYETCKNGHFDCAQTLLKFGADPHLLNCEGIMAIHAAVTNGKYKLVKLLVEHTDQKQADGCGQSPLHPAAKYDNLDVLDLLIEHGYDPNVGMDCARFIYMDRRRSALFFAVDNDSEDAAEMLLEAGAQTDGLDYISPLLVAISHSQYDMVDLLLSYGANINVTFRESGNYFPASIAFAMKDFDMLKKVVASGCDVKRCFDCPVGQDRHTDFDESVENNTFCYFMSKFRNHQAIGFIIIYLLQYVANCKPCKRLLDLTQYDYETWQQVHDITTNPRSLQHLSRLAIRDTLQTNSLHQWETFHELPIPVPLKGFLMFDGVSDTNRYYGGTSVASMPYL